MDVIGVAAFSAVIVAWWARRASVNSDEEKPVKRVLVIGAAGAIGKSLVAQFLRSGIDVVAALRKTPLPESLSQIGPGKLSMQFGVDVLDRESMASAFRGQPERSIDAVWCLAAPLSVESAKNPNHAHNVVVGGMERLLSVMAEFDVPIICFSDSIGSYGSAGPRDNATARWLTENPQQDPGSDYGKQKRECRELMKAWAAEEVDCYDDKDGKNGNNGKKEKNGTGRKRQARWAVIPGVLHTDDSWGDGTTEYALDALKLAGTGDEKEFVCPVPLDEPLPMIMRDDLIRGLFSLTMARAKDLHEPEGGYSMAGLSFTARELFSGIEKYQKQNQKQKQKSFAWQDKGHNAKGPAALFARLWPNSLSAVEAERDLRFKAEVDSLDEMIDTVMKGWEDRPKKSKM